MKKKYSIKKVKVQKGAGPKGCRPKYPFNVYLSLSSVVGGGKIKSPKRRNKKTQKNKNKNKNK